LAAALPAGFAAALPAEWQFIQRGLIITLKASVNSARERACASVMPAKAVGGRS